MCLAEAVFHLPATETNDPIRESVGEPTGRSTGGEACIGGKCANLKSDADSPADPDWECGPQLSISKIQLEIAGGLHRTLRRSDTQML